MDGGKLIIKPSAFDALSGRIIEMAGFEVIGVSGYGLSASLLGKPDVGLTTLTEVVDSVRRICQTVTLPVIADADTGFGNAINVLRATEDFIMAGAAGFHIEDQVAPKRCGHVAGKQLISLHEACGKIRAADRIRRELDPDFLVIARTDAMGAVGGGIKEAVKRARAYLDCGADMIFPDGIANKEVLLRCLDEIPGPVHYNMSSIGSSFHLDLKELDQLGVAIVSNPGGPLRAAIKAMWDYLHSFRKHGTDYMIQADKEFEAHFTGDLHAFIGFPEIRSLEEEFLSSEEVELKYTKSIGYKL